MYYCYNVSKNDENKKIEHTHEYVARTDSWSGNNDLVGMTASCCGGGSIVGLLRKENRLLAMYFRIPNKIFDIFSRKREWNGKKKIANKK